MTKDERHEEREFFKARKICTRCHKNRSRPGKTLCAECAEKERKYHAEHKEHYREYNREYMRRIRAYWKNRNTDEQQEV